LEVLLGRAPAAQQQHTHTRTHTHAREGEEKDATLYGVSSSFSPSSPSDSLSSPSSRQLSATHTPTHTQDSRSGKKSNTHAATAHENERNKNGDARAVPSSPRQPYIVYLTAPELLNLLTDPRLNRDLERPACPGLLQKFVAPGGGAGRNHTYTVSWNPSCVLVESVVNKHRMADASVSGPPRTRLETLDAVCAGSAQQCVVNPGLRAKLSGIMARLASHASRALRTTGNSLSKSASLLKFMECVFKIDARRRVCLLYVRSLQYQDVVVSPSAEQRLQKVVRCLQCRDRMALGGAAVASLSHTQGAQLASVSTSQSQLAASTHVHAQLPHAHARQHQQQQSPKPQGQSRTPTRGSQSSRQKSGSRQQQKQQRVDGTARLELLQFLKELFAPPRRQKQKQKPRQRQRQQRALQRPSGRNSRASRTAHRAVGSGKSSYSSTSSRSARRPTASKRPARTLTPRRGRFTIISESDSESSAASLYASEEFLSLEDRSRTPSASAHNSRPGSAVHPHSSRAARLRPRRPAARPTTAVPARSRTPRKPPSSLSTAAAVAGAADRRAPVRCQVSRAVVSNKNPKKPSKPKAKPTPAPHSTATRGKKKKKSVGGATDPTTRPTTARALSTAKKQKQKQKASPRQTQGASNPFATDRSSAMGAYLDDEELFEYDTTTNRSGGSGATSPRHTQHTQHTRHAEEESEGDYYANEDDFSSHTPTPALPPPRYAEAEVRAPDDTPTPTPTPGVYEDDGYSSNSFATDSHHQLSDAEPSLVDVPRKHAPAPMPAPMPAPLPREGALVDGAPSRPVSANKYSSSGRPARPASSSTEHTQNLRAPGSTLDISISGSSDHDVYADSDWEDADSAYEADSAQKRADEEATRRMNAMLGADNDDYSFSFDQDDEV
jgi:hypothetical protein